MLYKLYKKINFNHKLMYIWTSSESNDELKEDSRHVYSDVEYCNNSFNDSFTLPIVPDVLVECVFSGYY